MNRSTFRKTHDSSRIITSTIRGNDSFSRVQGEIFWELRDGVTKKITGKGHFKNTVTLDASILLGRLLKSSTSPHVSEPTYGVFALAVGTGDVGWDLQNPPPATNTQRSLFNEIGRKTIATAQFVTAGGAPSSIPTNVVDFTTTFSESEAVGPLTEMGLIGGDTSNNLSIRNPVLPPNGAYDPTINVIGLDTLINYSTFAVINKSNTSTLAYTWRISI